MTERIFLHKLGARISSVVFWVILVSSLSVKACSNIVISKQYRSLPFSPITYLSLSKQIPRRPYRSCFLDGNITKTNQKEIEPHSGGVKINNADTLLKHPSCIRSFATEYQQGNSEHNNYDDGCHYHPDPLLIRGGYRGWGNNRSSCATYGKKGIIDAC